MTNQRWLILVLLSWVALAVGIGLAVRRGAITADVRDTLQLMSAVLAVGVVPLTWLGLTGQLSNAARGAVARVLATPIGTSCLVALLVVPAVILLVMAARIKAIKLTCRPCVRAAPVSIYVDDVLRPDGCDTRQPMRPHAMIRATTGGASSPERALTDAEFEAGSAEVPVCGWSCRAALEPTPTKAELHCPKVLSGGTKKEVIAGLRAARVWHLHIETVDEISAGQMFVANPLGSEELRLNIELQPIRWCAVIKHPDNQTVRLRLDCFDKRRAFDVLVSECYYGSQPASDNKAFDTWIEPASQGPSINLHCAAGRI